MLSRLYLPNSLGQKWANETSFDMAKDYTHVNCEWDVTE